MKTLDSLLNIAKSVAGTLVALLAVLVASDVIPLPPTWRAAASAAGVALTGFSVWLTKNKTVIEQDFSAVLGEVQHIAPGLNLTALEEWAATVPEDPAA